MVMVPRENKGDMPINDQEPCQYMQTKHRPSHNDEEKNQRLLLQSLCSSAPPVGAVSVDLHLG